MKCIEDLNIKHEAIRILGEDLGELLYNRGIQNPLKLDGKSISYKKL